MTTMPKGPTWTLTGDFNPAENGVQILTENSAGTLLLGDWTGPHHELVYTKVGGLGPEWSLKGFGDYLGNGHEQVIIENNKGFVYLGQLESHSANGVLSPGFVWTSLGGLGPEWHFMGTADYLHDGHDQYMIENTSGTIAVGNVDLHAPHHVDYSIWAQGHPSWI